MNTADNRWRIAEGEFTHVWLSAEVATGEGGSSEADGRKAVIRRYPGGYKDTGDFLGVLQDTTCMYVFFTRCELC
jgi:hypothetical protein